MAPSLLDCQQLSQSFRLPDGSHLRAVQQVSLTLAQGQTVVVKGPSGSGKTTLLMMAAGMLRPQSGKVLLNGQDVYALSPARRGALRSSQIGVILPMFHLLPYLNAVSNISIAVPGVSGRRRAQQLMQRVGLPDRATQLPDGMSAGECRRLMVARALVHGPHWILADEPTSHLDDHSAGLIRELLREAAESGCGLLVVTHDDPALFHADCVYQMNAGNLEVGQTGGRLA